MNSFLDGKVTKVMLKEKYRIIHIWKKHLFVHFSEYHKGFLGNVSITLINKADDKDSKKRENRWMRTFKDYALFGLNIEDSVWPILCKSVNITGGLIISVFCDILVRRDTDLGQGFQDMINAFLYLLYCLFLFLLIYYFV